MNDAQTLSIILVNGPPQSGKDTVATSSMCTGMKKFKFASAVKNGTHRSFNLTCSEDYYEEDKDTPSPDFFGVSPRQAYIAYSETFMKPLLGKDIFGKILVKNIIQDIELHNGVGNYIITDCGFKEEVDVLLKSLGSVSLKMIRVHREGKDFSEDSLEYLDYSKHEGIKTVDLKNDGSISKFLNSVDNHLIEWGFSRTNNN